MDENTSSDSSAPARNLSGDEATSAPANATPAREIASIVEHITRLNHDLSQPLTYMLTALEMGSIGGGIDEDECKLLFEATLQMRDQLQLFRDFLRRIEPAQNAKNLAI